MPGLSLLCGVSGPLDDRMIRTVSSEDSDMDGYSTSILLSEQYALLVSSRYPEYPLAMHESHDRLMWLEGRVYQAAGSWYDSLGSIAADVLSGESDAIARAALMLAQIDGEFVLVVQERRSRDIVVFGDLLGRLPLYLYRSDRALIVSRNLSFVARALGGMKVDRFAAAECLLYGYPLGHRTLFADVHRVPVGTAIGFRYQARRVQQVNLAKATVASDPGITETRVDAVARELAVGFKRASRVRADAAKSTVLGLSGGLDSRSVAAALAAEGVEFTSVTRCSRPSDVEALIASKVASVLGLNWKRIPTPPATGADLLRLLRMKSGMNYLAMGFILPVFDSLQREYGRGIGFFTGDGGDKVLPDHRPKISITTGRALAEFVIAGHEVLPLPMVESLVGIPAGEILGELERQIASYPEESFEDKYTHFLVFERAFKWLFEGEDRNRHFFWSEAPFYARDIFGYALRCPARLKADYGLYRRFMEYLSPALVDMESTTCGPSLRLERHFLRRSLRGLRKWTRDQAPVPLRRRLRALRSGPSVKPVAACIREQLSGQSSVASYVSPSRARAVLEELTPTQAYSLLTVTSAIEYFSSGESTLERYRETQFT